MLALAIVGLFALPVASPRTGLHQDPKASERAASARSEVWTDRVAKAKVKAFEKALKPKKVSMADRKRALSDLKGGVSRHLIKPLQKFIERDGSVVLQREAVEMLAKQDGKTAKEAVIKLLGNARVTGTPQVQADLVRALSATGYTAKDWKVIDDMFESDYDNARIPVHEAILELVRDHKEKQAVPLLLNNMDEPSASNVDAAENPPREYWKARWHAWATWKAKVKEAMKAITGHDFANAPQARAWLKKNRLK